MTEKAPPPAIDTPKPDFGEENDTITFRGTNLSGVSELIWTSNGKSKPNAPNVASSTQMTGTVPEGMPQGDGTVKARNRGGDSPPVPFTFER